MLGTEQENKLSAFEKRLIAVLVISGCIIAVAYSLHYTFDVGYFFLDFQGQWALNAYALRGINPYPLIGGSVPLIEKIGTITSPWNTVPWGLLLGNVFYVGFLSLRAAKIYYTIASIAALFAVVASLIYKFRKTPKSFALIAAALVVSSPNFWAAIELGNAGGIVSCLLVLIFLWGDEHPYLSGIALSFAMVKPQIAAIFCLVFLLRKQFKLLITAAAIDIAAWGGVSLLLKENMLGLLRQFLSVDMGEGDPYVGIFSLLSGYLPSYHYAMLLSMFAGILFAVLLHIKLNKLECAKKSNLILYYPACIAVTFWCYTRGSDKFVLLIPTLICVWLMLKAENKGRKLFWFIAAGFYHLEIGVLTAAYVLTWIIFPNADNTWQCGMAISGICLIVVGVILANRLSVKET